jgi:hypothetical protein
VALSKPMWRNLSLHMQAHCYMNNIPCFSLNIHRINMFKGQIFPRYLHLLLSVSLAVSCPSKKLVNIFSSFT